MLKTNLEIEWQTANQNRNRKASKLKTVTATGKTDSGANRNRKLSKTEVPNQGKTLFDKIEKKKKNDEKSKSN